ncbi:MULTISPECIES: TVP38/TMEM64 family protein [Rhodococcus]|uniref:TVP38/TMEM64 family protein n=1 Tax=Rhodococcus TaxID=1827 RepID=UPI002155C561|nr:MULTISPECIES: TVP38/TMEM64 family protein [Rhodococcus]WKX01851.1 TVP38/TMEM64 family protein [Rhodococcus aetherivorans]
MARIPLGRIFLVALAVALVAAVVAVAAVVPSPPISQMREWAAAAGPTFVVAFFLAQTVLNVTPIPRTVFTLSAGVLFDPLVGIGVTIAATTVSAVVAFVTIRALGREAVQSRLSHPAVRAVDARLAHRGWLAVGSLRLIAVVPFAVVNYCCALSSVRLLPYTVATVAGILPGTIGVVLLGDAITGRTNPVLTAVTAVCLLVGVAGLLLDTRLARPADATVATTPLASSTKAPSNAPVGFGASHAPDRVSGFGEARRRQ